MLRSKLFADPDRVLPRLSPDGRFLAYLASVDGILNVCLQVVDEPTTARVITCSTDRPVNDFHWAGSSYIVWFHDVAGNEVFKVFVYSVSDGRSQEVDMCGAIVGRRIHAGAPGTEMLLLPICRSGNRYFDICRLDPRTLGLDTVIENDGSILTWVSDCDLNVIGIMRQTQRGIRLEFLDGGAWRPFPQSVDRGEFIGTLLSISAQRDFAYIMSTSERDTACVEEINLCTGASRILADFAPYDTDDVVFTNNGKPFAVFSEAEKPTYQALDDRFRPMLQRLEESLGHFKLISTDASNDSWIVRSIDAARPPRYYLVNRNQAEVTKLFDAQPDLEGSVFSSTHPLQCAARDGASIRGYVTLPRDTQLHNAPIVIKLHGGPWARDTWCFEPDVQWLAGLGFVVLQVNFRGSTGFGRQYLEAGYRQWSGIIHTDVMDALAWLRKHGYSQSKAAIMGVSFGGYAALNALTIDPGDFACAIGIAPPIDLVSLIESFPPHWASVRGLYEERVGSLEYDRDLLVKSSPISKPANFDAPLLVVHGANDPRVPSHQVDAFVDRLRALGKDVEYLSFADEGHSIMNPTNREAMYAACEKFLLRHLRYGIEPAEISI